MHLPPNLLVKPVIDLTVGGQPAKRVSCTMLDDFPLLPGLIIVIDKDPVYTIGYPTDNESAVEAPRTTNLSSWRFTYISECRIPGG